MNKLKRLYIFTGKGGVGKTILSLAFTQFLQEKNLNAKYVYFKNTKLDNSSKNYEDSINIPTNSNVEKLGLDLTECAQGYIAKKLKSKTIASWIIKTPFFKSLINMIPGFNYLIYMGQILELLSNDKNLVLILDSPSTGHAQTMLEAPHNFNKIFQSGIIYDDTQKMIDLISEKDFVHVNIISLPTQLSLTEALELKNSILKKQKISIETICNNSLQSFEDLRLPASLKDKIENEKKAIESNKGNIKEIIPYSKSIEINKMFEDLKSYMDSLA